MTRPAEARVPPRLRAGRRSGGDGEVIGVSVAVIGGLDNRHAAMRGGLPSALRTAGALALAFGSAYEDALACTVVIAIMARRPTGLIAEAESGRV